MLLTQSPSRKKCAATCRPAPRILHGMRQGEAFPLTESRTQERTVAYSSAAGCILAYGVEHDVELVVVGTHGKRSVRRFFLGSVAEEVVRKAPCPVVTVGRGAVPLEDMEGGACSSPWTFPSTRRACWPMSAILPQCTTWTWRFFT